jgi:hypothetical protein
MLRTVPAYQKQSKIFLAQLHYTSLGAYISKVAQLTRGHNCAVYTPVGAITRLLATPAPAWRVESVTADPEQTVFGNEPRRLQTTSCVFVERLTRALLLFFIIANV